MKFWIIFASLFLLCQGQNVEILCVFNLDPWNGGYACNAATFRITQNNTAQNIEIVGDHLPNKTNIDVSFVQINNQPVPLIITEFFTTFPNLQVFTVNRGLLRIQEDAFQFAQNLESLTFVDSPLRELPAYATAGAQSLKSIAIIGCVELETIDQNAFVGGDNIENIQIIVSNIRFLPENLFSTLDNLLTIIINQSPIQTVPAKLLDNNLRLEAVSFNNNINAIAKSFIDNLANKVNIYRISVIGRCGVSNRHPSEIDEIHAQLQQCYSNYEERRHFSLEFQGSLVIRNENGNPIFEV